MTAGALAASGRSFLASRDVPEPAASAEFLSAAALGVSRGELMARPDLPVGWVARLRFWRWVWRRSRRFPLGHILGSQPFMGMELEVSSKVLIPRPETEEVVGAALDLLRASSAPGRTARCVDLGTGSGCIALALARHAADARIVGVDASGAALRVARRNARRQGVSGQTRWLRADFSRPLPAWLQGADLVVSNPPYIPSGRIPRLDPEVRREPRAALDGGPDGLAAIRAVVARARELLPPGGRLVLEIDEGLGRACLAFMEAAGFQARRILRDCRGLERVALGRK
ncbi:MAG: peptide chain release factor N(5)-glutamine methyltransferase [Elusimicrobia bacterium]|nr:peptide chain release factor N(5)-glutamine methyltransferase [Elusimicrobiota bacterium]